jgi:alpha-amylase/alpha-mannosidase (GH57 family)
VLSDALSGTARSKRDKPGARCRDLVSRMCTFPPMNRRFVCLHGHFYQPPRENPWLEEVEVQDSAAPFHDWNSRIAAECYGPNGAARLKDGAGRIRDIVNNYRHISFNFGPTLLAWMERSAPQSYERVIEADAYSVRVRGHGNAIAQAYSHAILPLCNERDRRTQIRWGLADFKKRFGRDAEGSGFRGGGRHGHSARPRRRGAIGVDR